MPIIVITRVMIMLGLVIGIGVGLMLKTMGITLIQITVLREERHGEIRPMTVISSQILCNKWDHRCTPKITSKWKRLLTAA